MEGYLALIKEQREEIDKLKENYETSVEHLHNELRKQRKTIKYYLSEYERLDNILKKLKEMIANDDKKIKEYNIQHPENPLENYSKYYLDKILELEKDENK